MKKIANAMKSQIKEQWRKMMDSTKRTMSQGAQFIYKLMTMPHADNWRRKESKKTKKQ